MMPKEIVCKDCNEPMTEFVSKTGMRIFVCLHNNCTMIKDRNGMSDYGLVYCGIDILGLKSTFESLTKNSELTLKELEEATENKIDSTRLLKTANLALELDFEAEQLPELFNAAMLLGYSLGLDPEKTIELVITGIAHKSSEELAKIGVDFTPEQAYQWYKEINDILYDLTEIDRDDAWKEYAINQIIKKANLESNQVSSK